MGMTDYVVVLNRETVLLKTGKYKNGRNYAITKFPEFCAYNEEQNITFIITVWMLLRKLRTVRVRYLVIQPDKKTGISRMENNLEVSFSGI